jgi:RNA polymerase sigma-70 factor (ECF subfamily)
MTDEKSLVARTLSGDAEAFSLLLGPQRQSMMNLAYRITGNLESAEEISQEALIKVFKYLPKFQIGRSLRNWVLKITVNTAYDFLCDKKREENLIDAHKKSGVFSTDSPEKGLLDRELGRQLKSCLLYLTPKERMVFLLRDGEGFSVKETASLIRSSSMAVRTHLSRARSKLRERFPDHTYQGKLKEKP